MGMKSPEKRARIGERIKIAATQAGLTLKGLAEAIGLPPGMIYQYVRGSTHIPLEKLHAIAHTTGVSMEFFDPDQDIRGAITAPAGAIAAAVSKERLQSDFYHLQQLADAFDSPKRNIARLMETLHEMLALSRLSGNRKQEAYVLWRLGATYNTTGDYEAAREKLIQARDLFGELGMPEYRVMAILDLAHTMAEMGAIDAAIQYSREAAANGSKDIQWRAFVNIGGLYYRQHRYEEALHAFSEAARVLEEADEAERNREGIPYLMTHVADVLKDTGHYEAALSLWSRSLAQATEEKRADVFLESLLNAAHCAHLMGKLSEAKQRLEQAIVLATLLFEDPNRLSVARARLADVMVALGALDEAREHAKSALRIASRVGGPRGMILANMALAETCLAGGQFVDALEYVMEAIREAQRVGRLLEQAQARNTRARICMRLAQQENGENRLKEALEEAHRAQKIAERIDAPRERLIAHLTRAQCYYLLGEETKATQEVQQALEITRDGAVNLARLLGEEAQHLPALLRTGPLNLPQLFAGGSLQVPALEWQAYYLQGTLQAKRLGAEAAFEAMRNAAKALSKLLAGLTMEEALRFRKQHPEIVAVYEDLARFALTEADQHEAEVLLHSTHWLHASSDAELKPALPESVA
jgi:tetratricopeptide (TPR) repeat protein